MTTEQDNFAHLSYHIMANKVNRHRLAAQASQRGFNKLHRKLDARDKEIKELKNFINSRQLTQELKETRDLVRAYKYKQFKASKSL